MRSEIRKSQDRGKTRLDWLESYHSFSFGDYYDPKHMSFGPLVVLNDDIIAPKKGFGMHYHENAEIITIVLTGMLFHRDDHGFQGTIRAGEIQKMSAGSGVYHAEMNPSPDQPVRLLQIWLEPRMQGGSFSYESKSFEHMKHNELVKVVSGREKAGLMINQSADFFLGIFDKGVSLNHITHTGRAYAFVIEGSVQIEHDLLHQGDAVAMNDVSELKIIAHKSSKLLVIEV